MKLHGLYNLFMYIGCGNVEFFVDKLVVMIAMWKNNLYLDIYEYIIRFDGNCVYNHLQLFSSFFRKVFYKCH